MIRNRVGEFGINNQGARMQIIAYRNHIDIDVEFSNGYIKRNVTYNNFKNGRVKNPYLPSVYGIGYIGEGKHKVSVRGKVTPQYITWSMMIQRCYLPNLNPFNKTYAGCSVCSEWHNFQNFADWYDDNYYSIDGTMMNLDKDILEKGNKIYSPETCIFVPAKINTLFIKSNKTRGNLPIGVTMSRNSCMMQCHISDGKIINAAFSTPEQAFLAYKATKEKTINEKAAKYKDIIPQKLYKAMVGYRVEIND